MRIFLILAILGLMIAEGLLLPRTVTDFKIMRKMRMEAAPDQGRPVSLGPFAGYDAEGRPLTLVTDDTRWIVPLIVHSNRMPSDLEYLRRLRKAIPSRAVAIVGVCDGNQCGPAIPDVPILAYGSYAPLKDIARFDDMNQILLMNQFWGVSQSLRRTASAEELATEILKVSGS